MTTDMSNWDSKIASGSPGTKTQKSNYCILAHGKQFVIIIIIIISIIIIIIIMQYHFHHNKTSHVA